MIGSHQTTTADTQGWNDAPMTSSHDWDPNALPPDRSWRTSQIVRVTATATLTVLAIIGLLWVLSSIRTILLWVIVGVVLAIAFQPPVTWLERHGWNRIVASLAVSLGAVMVILGVISAFLYPVVLQADDFIRALPGILENLLGPDGQLHFIEVRLHILDRLAAITPERVTRAILGNQEAIVGVMSRAAATVAATISILTIMVMLLIDDPRAWRATLSVLLPEERAWGERIGDNFLRAVGGYVRGNLIISIVAGITSYVLLKIMGIPYAETLAVLVAVLDVIPLVGATVAAVIVCLIGFALGGLVDGVVLVVFFAVYQQFENNVLQTVIFSKTVALSPLVVFITALTGASLAGIVGVLLAIPLTSAVWVLAGDLIALRRDRAERHGGHSPLIGESPPEAALEGEPETRS